MNIAGGPGRHGEVWVKCSNGNVNPEMLMTHRQIALLLGLLVLLGTTAFPLSVNIRSYDHQNFTRLVLEGDKNFSYQYNPTKTSITIKLGQKAAVKKKVEVFSKSRLIDRVEHREQKDGSAFLVHLNSGFRIKNNFVLERPYRVVFDLEKSAVPEAAKSPAPTPPPPTPQTPPKQENQDKEPGTREQDPPEDDPQTATTDPEGEPEPEEPLLKPPKREAIERICIDPGHGGADLGAVGRSNTTEKEITLKVSKKLKRLIVSRLGLKVEMTREKDEEVSLNSRVSRANNSEADLFISIHVNSSFRKAARGPETYYVSLKATDQEAFQLSQKENAAFKEIEKITEDDKLKMILWSMAQTEYIKESSKLADFIQSELNILMHTRNRGVKQAPFRVLMRAAMPAVLVEIAFISNASEEQKLKREEFLDKVALAIYNGVSKYIYYHNTVYR